MQTAAERQRDSKRIRATLATIVVVALLLAVVEAAMALQASSALGLWLLAAVTGAFALALLVPLHVAGQGRLGTAVFQSCMAILAIQVSYLALYPRAYPAIAIASIVVVALALSFVSDRSLLRVTLASWAVAAAAVIWGTLGVPLVEVPAAADLPVLLGSGIAAVTVGMVLLWQFAHHMTQALEDARRLERAKGEFINTAAHELNTPLTPILIQLGLLRSGQVAAGPAQAHAIAVIDRNVQRMAGLVREMLDVARMQAGRLSLRREEVDLADAVREAVADYTAAATAKGIGLRVEGADGVRVLGDRQRIGQIVSNLLSNAIRLTPPSGSVQVGIGRRDGQARVEVRDTGIGLDGPQLAQLFQPFTRIHGDVAGASGTGLGLYICHGLAQEMGGRLSAESPGPRQGAVFTLDLPLAEPGGSAAAEGL